MTSISFCISVCNEHEELNKLLTQLVPHISSDDELIILVDESKVTEEVNHVLKKFKNILPTIKLLRTLLNDDFAAFKNNFLENAVKEWIMQIDADELLSKDFLEGNGTKNFKSILKMNSEIDLFRVARENYVEGLAKEYIEKWKWRVDEKGRINWKDAQPKIFKNNGIIKWKNKVHEVLIGFKSTLLLPDNYFLIHKKSASRQIEQNELYDTIMKLEQNYPQVMPLDGEFFPKNKYLLKID